MIPDGLHNEAVPVEGHKPQAGWVHSVANVLQILEEITTCVVTGGVQWAWQGHHVLPLQLVCSSVPLPGPEKSWGSTEQEHPPPVKSSEGFLWIWHGCHNRSIFISIFLGFISEFLGLAVQTMGHWESGSKGNCAKVEGLQPQWFRGESYQPWQEADIALDLNLIMQ